MTLPPTTNGRDSGALAQSGAPEAAVEFDLYRLDCAVDALRGQNLSPHRPELARIFANLTDLMETPNGHAH